MNTLIISKKINIVEKTGIGIEPLCSGTETDLVNTENEIPLTSRFAITDLWKIQRGKRYVSVYPRRYY